jgi:beta-barrel assembly-enhancing protease
MRRLSFFSVSSWMFLLILATNGLSEQKNSDIDEIGRRDINKHQINFISLEKEIALGKQLAAEIERTVKLLNDPLIIEFVNRLGQNLVRNSDAKVPFVIKVIDSEEVNAFALPGGFFYVNSGLILAADEEAQLAGVMAHEIAHVAARHGTEQYSKAQVLNLATVPLIFVGGGIGYGLSQAAGFLIPLQFLQFSRGAEREADHLGMEYAYKAGYDPTAVITFFEKLQAQEKRKPGKLSKLFSTHPPTAERIEKAQKEIATILPDRPQHIVSTSEFDAVRARLEALENRRKGDQEKDSQRPTLRRTPHPAEDEPEGSGDPDKDDRPTLKRRVS